ncbi:hypothetical protein CEXT_318781 [Caerostris extrusa]|uniref:Uncharacterized protein n=1 Tax=Caerostris extrusa TaxID=172846 RepID=A0AAV4MGZ9_CAEEX|nr:hypothetical protein CEXT_318781 [Caerostris extrusa]
MESPSPDMDTLLKGLLPEEGLLKTLPTAAREIMEVALNHYKPLSISLTKKESLSTCDPTFGITPWF